MYFPSVLLRQQGQVRTSTLKTGHIRPAVGLRLRKLKAAHSPLATQNGFLYLSQAQANLSCLAAVQWSLALLEDEGSYGGSHAD